MPSGQGVWHEVMLTLDWGDRKASFGTLHISLEATCQDINTKLYLIVTIFPLEILGLQVKLLLVIKKKKKAMPSIHRSRNLSSYHIQVAVSSLD